MYLAFNETMRQYLDRHTIYTNLIYRPKVIFPRLQPTDNNRCRFSLKLRLAESPMNIEKVPPSSSWPNVILISIQPKNVSSEFEEGSLNREYRVHDLGIKNTTGDRKFEWSTYEFPVGSKRSEWTLELLTEMTLNSDLIQLTHFEFYDCEPSQSFEVGQIDRIEVDVNIECKNSEFKCADSKLCIDESEVCDFSYDCGGDDTSDEDNCDHYLGRCNFEEDSNCDWSASPASDSWFRVTALEEDQPFYGRLPRPRVDHTFGSAQLGGHYMLLNVSQLKATKMYGLIGPRVHLREGAQYCNFRFWLSAPKSFPELNVSSPYLTVANEHIPSERLFTGNHEQSYLEIKSGLKLPLTDQEWQRHEVQLFNHANVEERSIFALQVSFGDFVDDLENFLQHDGYLALDDFSFSIGCDVVYRGQNLDSICGDHEFYCRVPSPITSAHCIPIESYCDFKNDCGKVDDGSPWATDEQDCPNECQFERRQHCAINKLGYDDQASGANANDDSFSWAINSEGGWVDSRQEKRGFMEIRVRNQRESEKASAGGQIRIALPKFSQSHANCSFQVTYSWSSSARNLLASIGVQSEDLAADLVILKSMQPESSGSEKGEQRTVRFGIGQRQQAFNLVIEAATLEPRRLSEGSLFVYEYKFLECAHFGGLFDASEQVRFEQDEDYDDLANSIDYLFQESAVNTSNIECKRGFFRCRKPVVCIPEDLVCDMQQDCQCGTDELDCKSYLMQSFDDEAEVWLSWDHKGRGNFEWLQTSSSATSNVPMFKPPLDHTSASDIGNYLLLQVQSAEVVNANQSASILSSRFKPNKAHACSLIFHVFFRQSGTVKLELLKRTFKSGELISESLAFTGSGNDEFMDRWQRIRLSMDSELDDESELELEWRGWRLGEQMGSVAIDDVAIGPYCQISSALEDDRPERRRPSDGSAAAAEGHLGARNGIGPLVTLALAACCLIASALVIVWLVFWSGSVFADVLRQAGGGASVAQAQSYSLGPLARGWVLLADEQPAARSESSSI